MGVSGLPSNQAFARPNEHLGSRLLLAVISMGFLGLGCLALVGDMMAMGPEDRAPKGGIACLLGIALCGFVLAALGGHVARLASGAMGAVVAAGVVWLIVQAAPSNGQLSRFEFVMLVGAVCVAAMGVSAVVVALRSGRRLAPFDRPEEVSNATASRQPTLFRIKQIFSWACAGVLLALVAILFQL